jgi:hypothetical protein
MTMAIELSDRYPLPVERANSRHGRKGDGRLEAVSRLKVGWSFHLPISKGSASVLLWWARARFSDREFTFRQEDGGGVRIWRTK